MSIHLKFQSALAEGESDLLSPLQLIFDPPVSFPTQRISDLLPSQQGVNLVNRLMCRLALQRVLPKNRRPNCRSLVGNPTFQSRSAIFHRFSTLTNAFSFSCSKISILEEI
ncbi:hypothetical protein AVEN_94054-1 [Araneus ventricosus]|uniref:Uncharacterized protein n=1 Tax=Araneus ventricosus TaxID=182803 RepID=A0A4Y2UTP8_ARAVE|nr:hypothetical protein AVEN_25782-1 [Araneus ventricosus]GBO16368.1 hypothetical protein AVEN_75051-1 [Araneus ventricosus]GBO16369.1 hypothetical protein AVEN_84703-1 [Araneus ventricosus]GBO16370.1 hypothetical protein AVEN_94054-1 [Araneus ventricosus]